MSQSYAAVVAGHVCLDIIPDLSATTAERFMAGLRPGRLVQTGPVSMSGGGAVSNTGRGLRILGIPTLLMGKVGDDQLGQDLRQVLQAEEGMIVDPASQTSYTIVLSPPGMDRFFLHYPGANDSMGADDISYDAIARARLFHFGYPPIMRLMYEDGGRQLADMFRRVRAAGVTTSLDLAMPDQASPAAHADWPAILAATLPYVDVFLPSLEEVLFMLRRDAFDALQHRAGHAGILPLVTPELLTDLSGQLLDMGARIVGLKLGTRGFYLRTASADALAGAGRGGPADPRAWACRELWAPIFRVQEVTAAGSGDAAIAGFLAGLLRGLTAEAALVAACAVGACNVEAADTTSGLRSWENTMERLAAGWEQHPLAVEGSGWRHDESSRLWRRD